MLKSPEKSDELDLELPALDAEDEALSDHIEDDTFEVGDDGGDAFDDATGDDSPIDLAAAGAAESHMESGWLVDADNVAGLDVGSLDLAFEAEGKVLADDEADGRTGLDDLIDESEEAHAADGGEEGPLAEDEELREEDLPALDADDDGDVRDEDLYDRQVMADDGDLRWDDRAWTRVTAPAGAAARADEADDSGLLAVPGDDAASAARDTTWRRLDDGGRAMAAAFIPGGSVVLAIPAADVSRALLVRVLFDGEARIIAEIDPKSEEGDACVVSALRWNSSQGALVAHGNFGVEAYKPG